MSHLDFYGLLPHCLHSPRETALTQACGSCTDLLTQLGVREEDSLQRAFMGLNISHPQHIMRPPNKLSVKSVVILWQNVYICGCNKTCLLCFCDDVIVTWCCPAEAEYMESDIVAPTAIARLLFEGTGGFPYIETLSVCIKQGFCLRDKGQLRFGESPPNQ